ncbi:helix-turn-helix domain-containing protein [Parasphingopyxis lamellibrachiae]|uniref:helix-turn-helix domain-containing protein n=1 Tax=Parasphingopyxis lamellibrachiae TaxID=680125 RepID=UPI0013C33476|nr:helix-turn-helix domain-containing protein [Parasphingopyxis lamellibrachiae]
MDSISQDLRDKEDRGSSLEQALPLLMALIRNCGQNSHSVLANRLGLPLATAHRVAQQLQKSGYLIRSRRGYYHAGPMLTALSSELEPTAIAAGIARPTLSQLARRYGCIDHFGIFEQDMVIYLLKAGKEKAKPFYPRDNATRGLLLRAR